MEAQEDIRWIQRLENYNKAIIQLADFITVDNLNKREEQGMIKSFEYTYELGWNLMKDYLEYQGETKIPGSRTAIRIAFNRGLISDGESWMDMVESRIETAHTYKESLVEKVIWKIRYTYFKLFLEFKEVMEKLKKEGGQ